MNIIHLKNLKPGFSFLEVMIAIVLLAVFGTSLFQVQTYIFSQTAKTHTLVNELLKLNTITPEITLKKFNIDKEKKDIKNLAFEKNNPADQTSIIVTPKDISNTSSLYKHFHKTTTILACISSINNKKETIISFLHTPDKKDSV